MEQVLTFDNLERISVRKPVERVAYMSNLSNGKTVLDIGCYDETSQVKVNTGHWLHAEITKRAKKVVGIDNSELIPAEGIKENENCYIYNVTQLIYHLLSWMAMYLI